jgi:hypothetical protein
MALTLTDEGRERLHRVMRRHADELGVGGLACCLALGDVLDRGTAGSLDASPGAKRCPTTRSRSAALFACMVLRPAQQGAH